MKQSHILPLALAVLITGCAPSEESASSDSSIDTRPSYSSRYSSEPSEDETEPVGSSSGDVGYYNPETGHTNDYTLDIDRNSDGSVDRINFPNGGYEDDFVDQYDNGDGTITVIDEDGREFTVDGSLDE